MSLKSVNTLTAAQLAKKWNLSLDQIRRLIDQGAKVEKEHTKSDKEAREIARDHIGEKPDYYKKLKKIEEGISTSPESDYIIGDPTGSSRKVAKVEEKNDLKGTCWKGYTAKGLKKKGNRMVPNCVPVKEEQIDEISAELVGKVSNARWRRGEAASKTLSNAIKKKFIESGKKKPTKENIKEETTMDTKELVNEALDNILENNLVDMKENFMAALQEKAMEKLEEKRKEIASSYFAQ